MTTKTLLKNKNYLTFISSATIGNIGDWLDLFALQIIFAVAFHANASMIADLWFFYGIPAMLAGKFLGAFVDKLPKKATLIGTDIICGLITLVMFYTHNFILMYAIVALRSFLAAANAPAQEAATQALVDKSQLLKASAYNNISFQLSRTLGPFLGAGLLIMTSARHCLLVNAASFFLSALILSFMRLNEPNAVAPMEEDSKGAWAMIKTNPRLLATAMISIIMISFVMMAMTQAVLLFRDLAPHKLALYGLFGGSSGLGALIIGAYLTRQHEVKSVTAYFIIAFLMFALATIGLSYYHSNWGTWYIILMGMADGVGMGIAFVISSFVVKKETPFEHIGKVSGMLATLRGISIFIGVAFSSELIKPLGTVLTYRGIGFALLLCALILLTLKLVYKPLNNL